MTSFTFKKCHERPLRDYILALTVFLYVFMCVQAATQQIHRASQTRRADDLFLF